MVISNVQGDSAAIGGLIQLPFDASKPRFPSYADCGVMPVSGRVACRLSYQTAIIRLSRSLPEGRSRARRRPPFVPAGLFRAPPRGEVLLFFPKYHGNACVLLLPPQGSPRLALVLSGPEVSPRHFCWIKYIFTHLGRGYGSERPAIADRPKFR